MNRHKFITGDLVKIIPEAEGTKVFGWLPAPKDINAILFQKAVLYGLYIGKSPCYNYMGYLEVLTESNIYTFHDEQVYFIQ
jgi:hypothetical protein